MQSLFIENISLYKEGFFLFIGKFYIIENIIIKMIKIKHFNINLIIVLWESGIKT